MQEEKFQPEDASAVREEAGPKFPPGGQTGSGFMGLRSGNSVHHIAQ